MQRFRASALVALVAFLWWGSDSPAKALVVAAPSVAHRSLNAPVIVLGKVTAIEKEIVQSEPFANSPQKVGYQVATIKIDEAFRGVSGITHVRLGFIPEPQANDPVPADPNVGGGIRIRRPAIARIPGVRIEEGMEACFFLAKHHKEDFYVIQAMNSPLSKKDANFQKDLATVKKALAVLKSPMEALSSDKEADRRFAAGILLMAYRQVSTPLVVDGKVKTEPISAEESRLILREIVAADWKKFDPQIDVMPPQSQFFSLGLTEAQGWVAPKFNGQPNFAEAIHEAAREWVKKHGNNYRIERIVEAPSKK